MSFQPIVETEYVRRDIVKYITITVTSVTLYKSVSLSVGLYDSNQNIVTNVSMILEGEEHQQWGNSDIYITELVATKLGFTLQDQDPKKA